MGVEELGRIIEQRRRELRITQPILAELAGISLNSLGNIENGKANPTIETLEKISEVLGLEIKLEVKQVRF